MADDLTTDPFDTLVALLATVDVVASMDPSELNLPGVWVALDEVKTANLNGTLELRCSLFIVAPDADQKRAIGHLAPVLNAMLTVLQPDGPIVTQGVVMPGNPTPLPALRVPVYLYTESE